MIHFITQRRLDEIIRDATLRGYALGYYQAEANRVGKGVIVGSKIDSQLEQILKDKGVL